MAYISFAELKDRVPIMDVVKWLDIELKQSKEQWRGPCPICEKDDPRVFVVTPAKKAWYCFNCSDGGDCIKLVANLQRIGTKEAAERINAAFPGTVNRTESAEQRTVPSTPKGPKSGALEPLKPLEHLSTVHPAIEALGLSQAVCEAIGIGYAGKGIMKGRVAFPIRLPTGELVGYQGLATSPDQSPLLLFPKNLEERIAAPTPKQDAPAAENVVDFRSFYRAS